MPSHTGLKINIQGEQLYMAVFYMVSEQHGHVYLVGLYIHWSIENWWDCHNYGLRFLNKPITDFFYTCSYSSLPISSFDIN